MLPFSTILEYGNTVLQREFYIGYNFDSMNNYGQVNTTLSTFSGTPVQTLLPVQYTGFSTMLRLTNSTIQMLPASGLNIGVRDFECTIIFYLYTGGTSYDYIMNFNDSSTENSLLMLRIADSGLGNRLQFCIGKSDISNRISCNKTRSDLEGKVNKVLLRRSGGVMSAYLNDVQMLLGVWTNSSTQSTLPNTENVQVQNYYMGEYQGTPKYNEDIGLLDFKIKFL